MTKFALLEGEHNIVYILIKNGANVNETDRFGKTALHWSSMMVL